jgi:hypothetical protein
MTWLRDYGSWIALLLIASYYWLAKPLLCDVADYIARRWWRSNSHSLSEKSLTVQLCMLATSHWLLIWPAATLANFSISTEILQGTTFDYCNAIVLGIGEFGISAILCRGVMVVLEAVDHTEKWDNESWRVIGSGGWIRHYLVPARIYPTLTSILGLFQVTAEEIVFRGIIFTCLGGGLMAACVSGCGFLMIQWFKMPNWKNAVFATIGALVIATCHGALRVSGCPLVALIVAHYVVFLLGTR